MFDSHFYFANLRNLTVAFGNLFNEIEIQRRNDTDVLKKFTVPLAYAPREDYLVKLKEDLTKSEGPSFAITLPRMSFEMMSLSYDSTRKINTLRYEKREEDISDNYLRQFSPVPYIVNFDLNLYSEYIDDALQVLEQILPYFSPNVNLIIEDIALMDINKSVSVKLNSVDTPIESAVDIGDGRTIIWTLSFSCDAWLYPPIKSKPIIKRVIENVYANNDDIIDQIITTEVEPIDAKYDDDWTIKRTIEER